MSISREVFIKLLLVRLLLLGCGRFSSIIRKHSCRLTRPIPRTACITLLVCIDAALVEARFLGTW
jgi:hypothetical protein